MIGQAERRRETAVTLAVVLDIVMLVPYTYVGIATGSWTIIAECLRGALLILVGIVSLVTLRRIHRKRLGAYEYGAGKLEQSVTVLIAALLILAAGILLWRISGLAPQPAPPAYLAGLAIVLVVLNFFLNCTQLWSLRRASRDGASLIVRAQYQARWVKTAASAFVVVAVTISMVSDNAQAARLADQLGTLTVIVIMVGTGIAMLRECLPDLLDRSLPETVQHGINRVLARNIDDFEQLGRIRTRRAGTVMHVEMELFLDQARSLGEASQIAEQMERQLAEEIPGVDAVIVLRASPDSL